MKGFLKQLAEDMRLVDVHDEKDVENCLVGWIIDATDDFTTMIHWDRTDKAQGFKMLRTPEVYKVVLWPDEPGPEARHGYDAKPWADLKDFNSFLIQAQKRNRLVDIIDDSDENYCARILEINESSVWFEDIARGGNVQNETILSLDSITNIAVDMPSLLKIEAKLST